MKVAVAIIDILITCIYIFALPIYVVISIPVVCIASLIKLNLTPFKVMYRIWIDGITCVILNSHNPDSKLSSGIYLHSIANIAVKCITYSIVYAIHDNVLYHGMHTGYGWYGIVFSYPSNDYKSGDASGVIVTLYGDTSRYTYAHEFVHVGQLFRYGMVRYIKKFQTKHKLGSSGYEIDWAIKEYTDKGILNEIEIEAVLVANHAPIGLEFDSFIHSQN